MSSKICGVRMSRVCVLLPSYNEAGTIAAIVREVKTQGLDVYVVDDGSSDGTGAIAGAEGAVVLRHEKNMGKGAALIDGFKHVLGTGCEAVIIMDADNQHEASSISDFINAVERVGADIVIGNRMFDSKAMPYVRRQTNRFMSYLISRMCRQAIPDTQCGYKLVKRKVLEAVSLEHSNFEIESELLIKAARKGFKISSVPIRTIYRDEKSKINPVVDTLRFFAFMIKMIFKK